MSDNLISRDEAKAIFVRMQLKSLWSPQDVHFSTLDVVNNLDAVEAVDPEVRTQMLSADCISRQAALDIVFEYAKWLYKPVGTAEDNEMYSFGRGLLLCIERNLTALPTVEPAAQPKRGKWVENSPVTMKCDQCGHVVSDWVCHNFNFCPSCGADMRKEKNDGIR